MFAWLVSQKKEIVSQLVNNEIRREVPVLSAKLIGAPDIMQNLKQSNSNSVKGEIRGCWCVAVEKENQNMLCITASPQWPRQEMKGQGKN